ncbi:hypothetical protein M9Y10_045895 [Tritrichomonas musculus]|uniref:Uncharacterized protein n=1 Tax=Tritrichomonas musculus TaxID=1915356 RepID=A0ABR2JWK0_9EUKA
MFQLQKVIIENIISNGNLKLQDEDMLLNFLIDLYEKDVTYGPLFEYVSEESLQKFIDVFDIEFMTNGIWKSICERILPTNKAGTSSFTIEGRRYTDDMKEFKHSTKPEVTTTGTGFTFRTSTSRTNTTSATGTTTTTTANPETTGFILRAATTNTTSAGTASFLFPTTTTTAAAASTTSASASAAIEGSQNMSSTSTTSYATRGFSFPITSDSIKPHPSKNQAPPAATTEAECTKEAKQTTQRNSLRKLTTPAENKRPDSETDEFYRTVPKQEEQEATKMQPFGFSGFSLSAKSSTASAKKHFGCLRDLAKAQIAEGQPEKSAATSSPSQHQSESPEVDADWNIPQKGKGNNPEASGKSNWNQSNWSQNANTNFSRESEQHLPFSSNNFDPSKFKFSSDTKPNPWGGKEPK